MTLKCVKEFRETEKRYSLKYPEIRGKHYLVVAYPSQASRRYEVIGKGGHRDIEGAKADLKLIQDSRIPWAKPKIVVVRV